MDAYTHMSQSEFPKLPYVNLKHMQVAFFGGQSNVSAPIIRNAKLHLQITIFMYLLSMTICDMCNFSIL